MTGEAPVMARNESTKNERIAAITLLLFMADAAGAAAPPAAAAAATSTAVPVEVFQAARALTAPSGRDYPQTESHHDREGLGSAEHDDRPEQQAP
jgi:hypothetical protein